MEGQIEIPADVIEALKDVRDEGSINMMSRVGVIRQMMNMDWAEAAIWLQDNKNLYLDALQAMGKAASQNGSGEN